MGDKKVEKLEEKRVAKFERDPEPMNETVPLLSPFQNPVDPEKLFQFLPTVWNSGDLKLYCFELHCEDEKQPEPIEKKPPIVTEEKQEEVERRVVEKFTRSVKKLVSDLFTHLKTNTEELYGFNGPGLVEFAQKLFHRLCIGRFPGVPSIELVWTRQGPEIEWTDQAKQAIYSLAINPRPGIFLRFLFQPGMKLTEWFYFGIHKLDWFYHLRLGQRTASEQEMGLFEAPGKGVTKFEPLTEVTIQFVRHHQNSKETVEVGEPQTLENEEKIMDNFLIGLILSQKPRNEFINTSAPTDNKEYYHFVVKFSGDSYENWYRIPEKQIITENVPIDIRKYIVHVFPNVQNKDEGEEKKVEYNESFKPPPSPYNVPQLQADLGVSCVQRL